MCGNHHGNDNNFCFFILLILLLQCFGGESSLPFGLLGEMMGGVESNGAYGNSYGNGCCRCRCGCGCS